MLCNAKTVDTALRRLSRLALFSVARQNLVGMTQSAEPAASASAATGASQEPASDGPLDQTDATATSRVVGHPVDNPTPATLKLYAGDWARFVQWCREQGCPALPADSETLAAYLLAAAPGLSRGALGRRRSAIATMHRQAGWPTPLLSAASHKALRTAAKPSRVGSRPRPTADSLARLAAKCPRDLPGLRDRALLLLAAATLSTKRSRPAAMRQPEDDRANAGEASVPQLFLLALDAEHVRFTASGVVLGVRVRSDETVPSRTVTLTRATIAASCSVRALEEWLRSSDTAFGPVFRKVDRWGNVEHGRLAPDAWHRILARRGGNQRQRTAAKSSP